ncbi:helix-turn-helix domain-containing protein [Lentzea sp. NPDC004782]|uniref:winged helix-turn-helix transcriptional regulator n=1 Tax=Lentzea sp. NPDC004782 TaxID=3154458 RepID=UPI0033B85BB5
MKRRDFGQYCGVARALELVGERWALLIVRDLLVRPRRYTDLQENLSGIPTNVLSTRLKELEQAGVVERQVAPAPQRGVVYALTADGQGLEPAILALGRWGAVHLGDPQPGDRISVEGVTLNLRSSFQPAEAVGVTASFEIHARDMVLHAIVADGELTTGVGPAPGKPDLTITAHLADDELASYRAIVRAVRDGRAELAGRRELVDTFLRLFIVLQPA